MDGKVHPMINRASEVRSAAERALRIWGEHADGLIDALDALADIGELENELRAQLVKFLIRVAASKNKLDPATHAFLLETAASSAVRNRAFDALIESSPGTKK